MHKLTLEKEIIGIYVSGHPLDAYKLELEHFVNCELIHFDRVKANGRQLKIAGIITAAMHGVNKRGNGYCRFTLQDYNGSVEMYLSHDIYQKHKGFIEVGQVIYVEGVFKARYQSDELFFNPLLIKLLSSVGEELTKSITLKLSIESITPEFIASLDQICQDHNGKHPLRMVVYDQESDVQLRFMAEKRKIKVDGVFVKEIEKIGVPYKLN